MRKCLTTILLFLCGILYAQPLHFVSYNANDGLSSNTVYAIAQDQDGCLWIGTRNGLNRFDGTRFQQYHKEVLPAPRVTSLAVDHDNRLWIGTMAGLCVSDGGVLHDGPKGHIRALLTDSDGFVWAATKGGKLYKMEFSQAAGGVVEHACVEYSIVNFEGDYPYQQIYEDAQGRLWLGGRIVHCQYIEDRQNPEVKLRHGENVPMGSYAEAGGVLYGFSDFESTLCIFDRPTIHSIGKMPLAHATLMADSKGRLWAAGSFGLGLVDTARPEQTRVYRHDAGDPNSLASTELYCIFEDRQGNIWVGGENGLSALCPAFQKVRAIEGVGSTQITDLMQASDGRIWVGTADSGAYAIAMDPIPNTSCGGPNAMLPMVEHVDYRPAGRTNEGHVSCLYEDSEGAVYIGLWAGCGFNIWKNGEVSRGKISGPIPRQQHVVAEGDRVTSNWIADFLEGSDGRFWVVSWEGVGLNEWDRQTGECLPVEWLSPFKYPTAELDSAVFLSSRLGSRILEAPSGDLVYGTTEAGLNIIDHETRLVTKYLPNPADSLSLPDPYVTDMCLAPDGTLWVATRGGLWSPSAGSKLRGMLVQSVEADRRGRLWAGTEEGLFFVDTDGSVGVARSGLGLPSNVYGEHVACTLKDGSMAFGGMSGAAIFDPDSLLACDDARVLLSEFVLDGGHLNFAFSSTSLPTASQRRFRYMLAGEDESWIEATHPNLQARYSNLPAGRYTLMIECSDLFGRWTGEVLEMPVRVPAPLLLRWPFLLLYVLLAFAIVRMAMLLHERRLRQDNARLELAVREKTERITKELETRNHFFSIISHDLRSPVHGVLQLSDELADKVDTISREELKAALDSLKAAAGSTSALLEDLLLWSLSQKNVLEPVIKDESLAEILGGATGSVRDKASAKRVSIATHLDPSLRLLTDRHMLTTCLRNIIDNAVRYSPEGGTVEVSVTAGDGSISITVADHGPGMDEIMLQSLYKPGHLGLVITKDLLGKINGTLSASNAPGGGCSMTINLNTDVKET